MTTNSPNPVDGDVQARKQKRTDHSKLATEIVHNLVSTDSCDEEVTEKLTLWVLNRLNKEFPTPPAQLLRPVELPFKRDLRDERENGFLERAIGWNECIDEVQRLNATAQPVSDGWIRCTDNLPDSEGKYLVYETLNNRVNHDYWMEPEPDEGFWNHYGTSATHWMQLPAAPGGQDD